MKNNILVVASHPDDEILGCSGTVARLIKQGYSAYVLILGEGVTARDISRNRNKRNSDIKALRQQAKQANALVGVKNVFFCDFPDNRFDTVAMLDIIKAVEKIKNQVTPDIVFTHNGQDLNIDHRITYNAVISAFRPLPGESARQIYSFEVPSSTEWNAPSCFSPDVFFDIEKTINIKLDALKIYKSEFCQYPHPRSPEAVNLNAKLWGVKSGMKFAEAFKNIRRIVR